MLTTILVCAMCAGLSVKAVSLRQKNSLGSKDVLSNSYLVPRLAALLESESSEMLSSQLATKAIKTAAIDLEGYIIERLSSDSSCNPWIYARSFHLNFCSKESTGEYTRMTATSAAEATRNYYTDSKCATKPKSYETITLGGCDTSGLLGQSYVYSTTSVPQSTLPFAKVS
jgi:hypothetical protein